MGIRKTAESQQAQTDLLHRYSISIHNPNTCTPCVFNFVLQRVLWSKQQSEQDS